MRCRFYPCEHNDGEGFCELDHIEVDESGLCDNCLELTVHPKQKRKSPIAPKDYEDIQNRLRRKLSDRSYGYTGKRREGYEDGILCAMSMLHSLQTYGGSSYQLSTRK